MQLKMESSDGKNKQPSSPPASTSIVSTTVGGSTLASSTSPSSQQHQNGSSPSGVSNGGKFRAQSTTSSYTSTSSSTQWPREQSRFSNSLPLRILVLKDLVGAIIGRGGGTIKQITQETHARVDVHRKESSTSKENVIMIYGNPENCSLACRRILEIMQQEARSLNRQEELTLKMLASNNLIGRIIGKRGTTIKQIMQQTETQITVSSANLVSQINLERIILITGQLDNMCKAEVMISQKLRQCFENDMFQYQQSFLYSGLNSPIPAVMGHQASGPLSLSSAFSSGAHSSHSHSALAYTLGASSQTPTRAGVLASSHTIAPSTSSAAGCSNQASHMHAVQPSAAPTAFYSSYNMPPYMFAPSGNISAPYNNGPTAGTPFLSMANFYNIGNWLNDPTKESVTIYIPNSVVGALIGRGGQSIREMMNQSGALIKVTNLTDEESASLASSSTTASFPDSSKVAERKVIIVGTPSAQYQAQYLVNQKVGGELLNQTSPQSALSSFYNYNEPVILKSEILVPMSQVRRIIGKNGSVIQDMQRCTGATIKLTKEVYPSASPSLNVASTDSANGSSESLEKNAEQKVASTSVVSTSTEIAMTAVHIIGDFFASFYAQRQVRSVAFRSSTVPSPSQSHFSSQQSKPAKVTATHTSSRVSESSDPLKPSQMTTSTASTLASATTSSSSSNTTTTPAASDKDNTEAAETKPPSDSS